MSRIGLILIVIMGIAVSFLAQAQEAFEIDEYFARGNYLTYDNRILEGSLKFKKVAGHPDEQYRAELFIRNKGELPIDFKDANYYILKEDGSVLDLEFQDVASDSDRKEVDTLNPEESATIYLGSSVFPDETVKEVNIELRSGDKIVLMPQEIPLQSTQGVVTQPLDSANEQNLTPEVRQDNIALEEEGPVSAEGVPLEINQPGSQVSVVLVDEKLKAEEKNVLPELEKFLDTTKEVPTGPSLAKRKLPMLSYGWIPVFITSIVVAILLGFFDVVGFINKKIKK